MLGGSTPPAWAGDDWVSKLVNVVVKAPGMKLMARQVMISTAEKKGIMWSDTVRQLEGLEQKVSTHLKDITDSTVKYPSYYTMPFHAYDEGNLSWKAAFEVEPATYVMASRVWPKDNIDWKMAQDRLRDGYSANIEKFVADNRQQGALFPTDIIDCGCSVGISTIALASSFPSAKVTGLDLSPYFLAVAKLRSSQDVNERWQPDGLTNAINSNISWVHGNAENTPFEDGSFDLFSLAFVTHELPQFATQNIFEEAFRVLKPGGIVCLCDNDPQSEVIRNLPPVIFTLMKSTEPWSDDYYTMDMQGGMAKAGFVNTRSVLMDPRHRIVLGMKPSK